jgi:hypothetical protein
VTGTGFCIAHSPGGADFMRDIASRGGQATRARLMGVAFEAEQLPPLRTIEDAKAGLDQVRIAVMTRRLTHAEGNAASKAIAEWIKGEGAAVTSRLVNELRTELDAKEAELAALRKQPGGPRRAS